MERIIPPIIVNEKTTRVYKLEIYPHYKWQKIAYAPKPKKPESGNLFFYSFYEPIKIRNVEFDKRSLNLKKSILLGFPEDISREESIGIATVGGSKNISFDYNISLAQFAIEIAAQLWPELPALRKNGVKLEHENS